MDLAQDYNQQNEQELAMLCVALQDTERGLFLFQCEAAGQKEWAERIRQWLGSDRVSINQLSGDEAFLPLTSFYFKEWVNDEPNCKIYILCNLQLGGGPKKAKEFCEALNYVRDELTSLGKIFVFGASPYFALLLSRFAPDFYSFFMAQAHFKAAAENGSDDRRIEPNHYTGDVRVNIERFLEYYHVLCKSALSIQTKKDLSYQLNFLQAWLDVWHAVSYVYSSFVRSVADCIHDALSRVEWYGPTEFSVEVNNYSILAESYRNLAVYNRSLQWYRKILDILIEKLGAEHPDTAATYNDIAEVYEARGDYPKALEFYEKALAIRESVLGKEHPDAATTYNDMAGVYQDQGDYPKALEFCEKALGIRENVLGKEHPDTATTYNNMAGVYQIRGDYPKALEFYEKALAIRESMLGKEHPVTAGVYDNMALVYDAQGDYPKALELYKKSLTIKESILGKEHPNTATTYDNMAGVYEHQGDYPKALEFYEKALAIRESMLGKEHPVTAATYNNMAIVYKVQGDYFKALRYYLDSYQVMLKKLGLEHDITKVVLSQLKTAYTKTNPDPEAFEQWLEEHL